MDVHAAALPLEWTSSEYMLRWLRRMPDVTVEAFGRAVIEAAACGTGLDDPGPVDRTPGACRAGRVNVSAASEERP